MKNFVPLLFLLALMVCGCTQDDMLRNGTSASGGRKFTASFEQDDSRTYVEDGRFYRWTEGDLVSLFDASTLNGQYMFDGETGDSEGTFSLVSKAEGTGTALSANYAVYPYSEDVKISGEGEIRVTLPSEQHYAENSFGQEDNTMVAVTKDVDDTFLYFKNVGGCIKLQLYGDDVTVKSITLVGNNGEKIAGQATLSVAYGKAPSVTMADDAETSITIDCGEEGVKIGSSAHEATAFWMVVPPTTFEKGITVIVKDVENKVFTQTTDKQLVIGRNVVKPMAAAKLEAINSNAQTDYVDLKFDMPNVSTNYNLADGSLTITYPSGSMPRVEEGNAIVLPAEYGFDIRVVESISTSGNTLDLKTSQGNMANLFRNASITLTTDPEVISRSVASDVYAPVAFGYMDANGKYHEVYNESRAVYPVEQFKWELQKDFNGQVVCAGSAGRLAWDKCEYSTGLKGTFTFDFGEKRISQVRSIGDLKRVDYRLTGNLDIDMLLHYDYESAYSGSGDAIIGRDVIPMKMLTFRPKVAGVEVPVHIQIYTHVGSQYICDIEGRLDATAGVKMGNEVSVGVEWTQNNGGNLICGAIPYFEFYPLTVDAEASAEAKVSLYPQWEIGIYGFKAIWLESRPYLKEKVDAGFRASTDGENYIGWRANTYTGMDIRMGLEMDFGFWRKDIWTSDIYNCLEDNLLFEAPSRITTLSPENGIEVAIGDSVKAEFLVESFSPITNEYYPCPRVFVNFEPDCGELSHSVAITDDEGKTTVTWTPYPSTGTPQADLHATESAGGKLTAKVVDKNGKSIDDTNLYVTPPNDDADIRALLKLIYDQTNGDNWNDNENWLTNKPVDEWEGVHKYVDETYGEYFELYLDDNNLTGYIDFSLADELASSAIPKLSQLHCMNNKLTSVNVSGSTILYYLNFTRNQLTKMEVENCPYLYIVYCDENRLTNINLPKSSSLETLDCSNNQLTSLNVSGFSALVDLKCSNNQLVNIDVSDCPLLEEFDFSNNPAVNLKASGCMGFDEISYWGEHIYFSKAEELMYSSDVELASLDVSNNTSLRVLWCDGSEFTRLNVTGCSSLVELNCQGSGITNLDVSSCSSLKYLSCYDNRHLTSLNASGCSALDILKCSDNNLTNLDVTGCTALSDLDCSSNSLTSLDVLSCTNLTELVCFENPLTSLNLSGLTALTEIMYPHDTLTELNLSGCTSLQGFSCSYQKLTSLNVSGCTSLEGLDCSYNELTSLKVTGCTSLKSLSCSDNKLTSLNLTGCTALTSLDCSDNSFTTLDVLCCTNLYSLNCEENPLTSLNLSGLTAISFIKYPDKLTTLNLSGCTSLKHLDFSRGELISLNVSGCTSLYELSCSYNKLTSLDASGCTSLIKLYCDNNELTSLNISDCTNLNVLFCNHNNITSVIPKWFSQFTFVHDARYTYWSEKVDGGYVTKYKDKR